VILALAGRRELADLLGEILPYAGQLAQLRLVNPLDRVWPGTDRVGSGAVRANLETVLSLDFEQVGDLSENPRDLPVIHA
jgi:hypothetical protein